MPSLRQAPAFAAEFRRVSENAFVTKTVVAVCALIVLAGCGGETAAADRTIEVEMRDNVFEPASIDIARGETVRFVFSNGGQVAHDAVVGDAEEQREHGEEMAKGDMHHGSEGDAITVEPGETGEITYTFDDPGRLEIGCHQPGHYAAGMKIDINVT